MDTFRRKGLSATSTLAFSYKANPCEMMLSVYFPGGRFLNSYTPWPLVCTEIGAPITGVMTTLALVMAAPDGSVTCPRSEHEPGGACAHNKPVDISTQRTMI